MSRVGEADLSGVATLQEFERNQVSRNRVEVIQSHDERSDDPNGRGGYAGRQHIPMDEIERCARR